MVYDFPIYFFKVKYEGTNVVKLLEFCVRNGRSKWTVTRAKYKEVMSFVREFCPFIVDVKLVFGIDKEGDEVSECMNVVGRVPVASSVFL